MTSITIFDIANERLVLYTCDVEYIYCVLQEVERRVTSLPCETRSKFTVRSCWS